MASSPIVLYYKRFPSALYFVLRRILVSEVTVYISNSNLFRHFHLYSSIQLSTHIPLLFRPLFSVAPTTPDLAASLDLTRVKNLFLWCLLPTSMETNVAVPLTKKNTIYRVFGTAPRFSAPLHVLSQLHALSSRKMDGVMRVPKEVLHKL